jgi:hypothetical protein
MKKLIAIHIVLIAALLTTLGVTGVFATENSNASAKATAGFGYLDVRAVAEYPGDGWWDWFDIDFAPVLTQQIKTANAKDLFIDLALQTGCYTTTEVKSKNMQKDTSLGACQIWVWITVDGLFGERVYPRWPIVFDSRIQRLSATLQGEITATEPITIGDPEVIELFIGTMSCHSFNFIVEDLDAGMHTIRVYVWATSMALGQEGSAEAVAAVGLGSMTVEEVRMVKDDDITLW